MRIVIFGGSFNPIHTGHAMIANTVSGMQGVDEVWLLVSPQNPLKEESGLKSEEERLRLAAKVAELTEKVKASDFEFSLPRPSYTYKTLCELKKRYPEHEFRLLIGSDNWEMFSRWRNPEKIVSEFGVLIYQRPDCPATGPFPNGVKLIENVPMMLVSSTYIRERLKRGEDVRFLIPDVIYKETEELYGR